MNPIRSSFPLFVAIILLPLVVAVLGQVPDVPPPTMDQEGTEQSWDITHPGWRQWNNTPQKDRDEGRSASTASRPVQPAQPQPSAAELQKKKEQEERWRQLEVAWQQMTQDQQQKQKQAAERQRDFEQAKHLLLASFQTPSDASLSTVQTPTTEAGGRMLPYGTSFGSGGVSISEGGTGLSPIEWQQARHYQGFVDVLSRTPAATVEDRTMLDIAEVRRNQLWAKAASVPGLPDDDREALALSLPVVTPPDSPRLTLQDAKALHKSIQSTDRQAETVVTSMLSDLYVYTTSEATALAGEAMIKRVLDEDAAGRFGDFLGVSKIALATAQDGASSGIAAAADFFIGKIPLPQSTVAVTGGRQYANVVYQVQSKFMVDAMKATGADFDVQEFWRNFKEELNTGQKAVMEFVSYGPQN
jgi:hypothetical protein